MKTKPNKLMGLLAGMNACQGAQDWVEAEGHETLSAAWTACPRVDWMLWFAGRLSGPPEGEGRKKLVLAACECARLALPYAKKPAVLACIETAEAWATGKATMSEVRKARSAASAAAADAADAYADDAYTADAADAAADAAAAAAYAAAAAAAAADAYAYAAAADAYAAAAYAAYAAAAGYDDVAASAARKLTLALCAHIVRKHYPKSPLLTH